MEIVNSWLFRNNKLNLVKEEFIIVNFLFTYFFFLKERVERRNVRSVCKANSKVCTSRERSAFRRWLRWIDDVRTCFLETCDIL